MRTALNLLLGTAIIFSTSACSARNYTSQEGLFGTLLGTGIGSGIGWVLGEKVGNKGKNIAVNAAIGGGLGLLGGAVLNQRNIQVAREREVVVREARMISKNQRELDRLRSEVYESSSWGQNEVKSWDQRYTGRNDDRPFMSAK